MTGGDSMDDVSRPDGPVSAHAVGRWTGAAAGRLKRGLQGLAVVALLAWGSAAWAQNVYQMYYVPVPEHEATLFNRDGLNIPATGATGATDVGISRLSISVVLPGTMIYYDHSEDGYENDITNPTQPTTSVWGDGNCENGHRPDITLLQCQGDPALDTFAAGDVVVLDHRYNVFTTDDSNCTSNAFPATASSPTDCRFNAGDRFGSNKALAVSRVFLNQNGSGGDLNMLTGSVEVEAVSYWGTEYVIPVGQNTETVVGGFSPFERVDVVVQASEPGTVIDVTGVAGGPATHTLGRGESIRLTGVQEGATITSNDSAKPVQVNLLTGDVWVSGVYASRWYRITPSEQWAHDYYSPVGETHPADDGRVAYYLYADSSFDVTVEQNGVASDATISLVAGQSHRYLVPPGQSGGLRFSAAEGNNFYAIAVVDAVLGQNGGNYDWGFSLVPTAGLTGQTVIGYSPGGTVGGAANPVWVVVTDDTTICVDYNRDGNIDHAVHLSRLQSVQVSRNDPGGMVGALIYSINKDGQSPFDLEPFQTPLAICDAAAATESDTQTDIAVVWGLNPLLAHASNDLDAGTTVLSVPKYGVSKRILPFPEYGNDADSSGTITPGDTIVWEIEVDNYGPLPLYGGELVDNLPEGVDFNAALSDDGWSCDDGQCTLVLGPAPIPAFTTARFSIAATIPDENEATGVVVGNIVMFYPPGGEEPLPSPEATAPVRYADVTTTLTLPPVFVPGGPTVATVNFGNVGEVNAANVGYTLTLPPGVANVTCSASCTFNPATGVVTFSGQPTSLSPGQWTGPIQVNFNAPDDPVPFDVESRVTTTSHQPVGHLTDTATAQTETGISGLVDVTTQVSPPAVGVINQPIHVPVSFTNYGPETAESVGYTVTLPTTGIGSVSCLPDPPYSCNYDSGTGEVTVSNLPEELASGESVNFTLVYTPIASGTFVVQTEIVTTSDEPLVHAPNSAQGPTVVVAALGGEGAPDVADPTVSISPPPTAEPGDEVRVPVTFTNLGPRLAEEVEYFVDIDGLPPGAVIRCEPDPPVACAYDGTTVTVTTGLPTELGNNQTVAFDLFYDAPTPPPGSPITVTVTGRVTTSTLESNLANNTATAQTLIGASPAEVAPIPTLRPLAMLLLVLAMAGLMMRRRLIRP